MCFFTRTHTHRPENLPGWDRFCPDTMHERAQRICITLGFPMLGPRGTKTSRGQAVHFNRAQEADVSRSSRVVGVRVNRPCLCVCVLCSQRGCNLQTDRKKGGGEKKLKSDWLSSLQEAFIEQRVRSP